MESILTSIKKLLGIPKEYEHFDADIIMHINSVFMILTQLGSGPTEGFIIIDEDTTWDEFIPERKHLNLLKTYVYMKVRLMFDPPASSSVLQSIERMISEFEWRIHIAAEAGELSGGSGSEPE